MLVVVREQSCCGGPLYDGAQVELEVRSEEVRHRRGGRGGRAQRWEAEWEAHRRRLGEGVDKSGGRENY